MTQSDQVLEQGHEAEDDAEVTPALGALSRRRFLRRALGAGAAMPALLVVLQACGDDDDEDDEEGGDGEATQAPARPTVVPPTRPGGATPVAGSPVASPGSGSPVAGSPVASPGSTGSPVASPAASPRSVVTIQTDLSGGATATTGAASAQPTQGTLPAPPTATT